MKKILFPLTAFLFLFVSCNSDDDGIENGETPDPTSNDVTVQNFMWQAMNLWYFWQAEVPNLADDRFSSDEEYTEFLASTPDPEQFYEQLQFSEDRFSFFNEDFSTLVNGLNGISRSNGLEFGLVRFADSDDVFGYVQYIIPNSNASTVDIQRGDIFTRVDGQVLNVSNFRGLLFGENTTYTLGLATIENNTITDTDEEVTLTKEEGLVENPIFLSSTLNVNGQQIGYLMYNAFNRNFNDELNEVFGQFVADGVTDLILDFRYNGGGSVNTSRLLASMISGNSTNDLYIRQRWNDKIQAQLSAEQLEDYFANQVDGTPLNAVGLNRVFVLTTGRTASASELVMNGLDPYIEVIQIGETTSGKNEFSITLVDDSENSFIYNSSREDQINPDNSWALQPLVGRNENADGFSDYTAGFTPDILLEEDLANLGVLGDENEPLLARALQEITGETGKRDFSVQMPAKAMANSKMLSPLKDKMFLDKPISFK